MSQLRLEYKYNASMLCQQRLAYVLYREMNVRILVMCFNVENFLLVFITRTVATRLMFTIIYSVVSI
jgi:hypothetical protein